MLLFLLAIHRQPDDFTLFACNMLLYVGHLLHDLLVLRLGRGQLLLERLHLVDLEQKADVLEAVMGLGILNPSTDWAAWGDMVAHICTDVHEAWSSPELIHVWDQTVLNQALFARFGLDDFCISFSLLTYHEKESLNHHLQFLSREHFRMLNSFQHLPLKKNQ